MGLNRKGTIRIEQSMQEKRKAKDVISEHFAYTLNGQIASCSDEEERMKLLEIKMIWES